MTKTMVFMCRCIACRKKFEATDAQIKRAEREGCMISPCCQFPATVVRATRKTSKERQPKQL